MRKIITAPGMYVQGEKERLRLPEYIESLGKTSAYIIVDTVVAESIGEEILSSFATTKQKAKMENVGNYCSKAEIDRHLEKLQSSDLVVGIGGGKVMDVAKAVAYKADRLLILLPSVASTDAPCSRQVVLSNEEGSFVKYLNLPKNPDMVVADLELILNAPARFLAAGMGDALSTYYEAMACKNAKQENLSGGMATQAALAIAETCKRNLMEYGKEAMESAKKNQISEAFENIVETNIYLSGIGFESGGLSLAHAICDGLSEIPECRRLHGEKAAFGTMVQLQLEGCEEQEEIKQWCRSLSLPVSLLEMQIPQGDPRLEMMCKSIAKRMKKERKTVFSCTDKEILAAMNALEM